MERWKWEGSLYFISKLIKLQSIMTLRSEFLKTAQMVCKALRMAGNKIIKTLTITRVKIAIELCWFVCDSTKNIKLFECI